MFGFFEKRREPAQPLPRYTDIYDTMLYRKSDVGAAGALPTIYAFRVKDTDRVFSPDPRPDFVLLETDDEIQAWQEALAGPVVCNDERQVTDAPLLVWNSLPSLLTGDDEIIAMYAPVRDADAWPVLALQTHPFDKVLDIKPARDRYYFQQNKFIGLL